MAVFHLAGWMLVVISCLALVAIFWFYRDERRPLQYTFYLCMLLILTSVTPLFLGANVEPSEDIAPCFQTERHILAAPCIIHLSPSFSWLENGDLEIDRYSLWELIAIVQSLFFASVLFLEMSEVGARKKVGVITAATFLFVRAGFALFGSQQHQFHIQLLCLLSGTSCFLVLDLLFLKYPEKAGDSEADRHEAHYDKRLLLGVDLPLVIGTLAMTCIVWPAKDLEIPRARLFAAGGTAFGMVLSNLGIIVLRILLHIEHHKAEKAIAEKQRMSYSVIYLLFRTRSPLPSKKYPSQQVPSHHDMNLNL